MYGLKRIMELIEATPVKLESVEENKHYHYFDMYGRKHSVFILEKNKPESKLIKKIFVLQTKDEEIDVNKFFTVFQTKNNQQLFLYYSETYDMYTFFAENKKSELFSNEKLFKTVFPKKKEREEIKNFFQLYFDKLERDYLKIKLKRVVNNIPVDLGSAEFLLKKEAVAASERS